MNNVGSISLFGFCDEVDFPAGCDIGSADFGDEMAPVSDADQADLYQVLEGSAHRRLAAMASFGRLSDAERYVAVVVSGMLPDEQ